MKNQDFFDVLSSLTQKLLPIIRENDTWPFNIRRIENYPKVAFKDSPFPEITNTLGVTDISNLFNKGYDGRKPEIDLDGFEEFLFLKKYLLSIPEFVSYNSFPNETDSGILDLKSAFFIRDIITAYYYRFDSDFNVDNLKQLYEPVENYIYAEDLFFDIGIPILFVTFDTDYLEINESIFLRKISEATHKAKHNIRSYSPPIADALIRSASHELVLRNYTIKKPESAFIFDVFGQSQAYPHQLIQKFFIALKILLDYTSGYAQVIIHPSNWAKSYNADLIPLTGTSVKCYPSYFDDFFWNSTVFPKVPNSQLESLSILYNKILQNKENKLEIASKRFYKSMMREEEEDIILDLIIAFEVLLSDNEKSELTHKLSLRIATLIANFQKTKSSATDIFNNVKKIYDYRSAIVHGHAKAEKKKEIKLPDQTSIKAVLIAKDYLREVLKILIDSSKYLDPKLIDELMLSKNSLNP